ncbi:MAG: DNA helicase II [Methylococcaceae bacterium]|nr:DNA helicase II [Methylococcaceae bacterium]
MDVTQILDPLNPAQRLAVGSPTPTLLVLAGAGSGKTRVLVHRIAWLIRAEGIPPQRILAVTFTNKAAHEMRGRIEALLTIPTRDLWVGTFHGLAHRFLRRHAREAGLADTFQILDADDQHRVVRRLIKGLGLDETRWPARQAQWYINAQKEEGRRVRHLSEPHDPFERQMLQIYQAYEEICDRSSLVDFAELLLRAYELLRDTPELLGFYQQKFQHILVDEFQDTNRIQYLWLRLLSQDRENLFAVGDDDQSIYSWRGAMVENLQHFQRDYPSHTLVRLEQNYRSTGHILAAANALITHNQNRLGKNLWTELETGEALSLYNAFNEQDEAYFVVNRIQSWSRDGHARRDAAILYRSNAQSRQFEEKLVAMGIPYRVYGGLRFFERAEIKDALAYLRLVANPQDDASFERIINTPVRGIGAKTLDILRGLARTERCSLWHAMATLCADEAIPTRARKPLLQFKLLMEDLADSTSGLELWEQTQRTVQKSGLIEHYRKEPYEQAAQRIENLEELTSAARQFEHEPTLDAELPVLDQFLAHAALESGESQSEATDDCVQLMTLHAAKGLEFKLVFMVGLEEGLFPSLQSLEDTVRLEEERRLCYVGITRARQKLYLTYAESRRIYGKETYPRPSRFLREIPPEHLDEVRLRGSTTPSAIMPDSTMKQSASKQALRIGQRVRHVKFGEGVILQSEGEGTQARVQVNFAGAGVKWLMLAYANLQAVA